MNSFDALLSYHEAEMKLTALEKEIVTSPARVRLNKLRGILTEQQKLLSNIQSRLTPKTKASRSSPLWPTSLNMRLNLKIGS